MNKRLCLLFLLCVIVVWSMSGRAMAMNFTSAGYVFNAANEPYLIPSADNVNTVKQYKEFAPIYVTAHNGDELQFVPLFDKFCLKLTSRDGSHDYLSFTVAEGEQVWVQEIIGTELFETKPQVKCWAIITRNVKSNNVINFWLVSGPVKERYVPYVSMDSLSDYGFNYQDFRLDIKYSAILVRGGTRWLKPENRLDGTPVKADAAVLELFWDDVAEWFGIKKIV